MRPLGAIILGAYIDQHGRRKGLLVDVRHDGVRDARDRLHAGLRDDRDAGSDSGGRPRLVQGLSAGVDSAARACIWPKSRLPDARGFLRVAIGQPAGGRDVRGRARIDSVEDFASRGNGRLGMARAFAVRLAHDSVCGDDAALAPGNR